MTVCLATMFTWNYGSRDNAFLGPAVIVMSDRKITAGDVEYEPNQTKVAFVNDRTLIAIAGDYSLHSEALRRTMEQIRNRGELTTLNIASIYAQEIKSIKQRHAEDLYLSPLGLNVDTFLSQQREYSDRFIDRITEQMQQYHGQEVEALVVGGNGTDAYIIHIDQSGMITDHGAVGFATIGIGSWHARSKLMQSKYVNTFGYSKALTETYAAKKAAQTAPGVGTFTDIVLVTKGALAHLREEDLIGKMHAIYETKLAKIEEIEQQAVDELQSHLDTKFAEMNAEVKGSENEG